MASFGRKKDTRLNLHFFVLEKFAVCLSSDTNLSPTNISTFFGAILPIAACLLPLSLSPPPPPPNTATTTTSILPRDVFFLKTPIVSSAITRTKTRNSTQRVLPWRFQFGFPEPPLLLTSRCSVLEHEFETPRSKSDATQLTLDDPEQSKAPLTSPFSVDSPRALDLKLETRAIASNSVEVPFAVRESAKVKEKSSRSDASQLASDDPEWAPLTSPFSVNSPLTLDLKVRASVYLLGKKKVFCGIKVERKGKF